MNKEPSLVRRKDLISRADAQKILSPWLPSLLNDLDGAWGWTQTILDQDPERRVIFDMSLQAGMVSQRFIHQTRQRLHGEKGVAVKMFGRHMSIIFDGRLKLRLKKFDNNLHSRNVRTNRQSLIYHQTELEGMEAPTDLTFGYVRNRTNTEIAGVYVTCPIGWTRNQWMIAVRDPGMDSIPLFDNPENPDEPGFIVKLKSPTRQVEDFDGDDGAA